MVAAVELVLEELNGGTELVTLHLHNMEGILALGYHHNQPGAIRTHVQVRKYKPPFEFYGLLTHEQLDKTYNV